MLMPLQGFDVIYTYNDLDTVTHLFKFLHVFLSQGPIWIKAISWVWQNRLYLKT